jgi:polyhydroxybutyrate depolymerase
MKKQHRNHVLCESLPRRTPGWTPYIKCATVPAMKKLFLLLSFIGVGCDPVVLPPDPPEPIDPCAAGAPVLRGDEDFSVIIDGIERTYTVSAPTSYDGAPTPVVFNFHGLGSNGFEQRLFSKMDAVSDAEGFIAVYPNGTGESWNAGECCPPASNSDVDDVAFVQTMIADITASYCVDQKQIFATGMSNGGFFSHRLGCEVAEQFAAIAPVAGGVVLLDCQPSRPIPVMHFHGTADDTVPFDGLPQFGLPAIPDMINDWAARNGCQGAAVQTFLNGDSHCETFDNCAAGTEVTLCTVEGGGHTWPGGLEVPQLGFTTQDLNATQHMWDFFEQHPLP